MVYAISNRVVEIVGDRVVHVIGDNKVMEGKQEKPLTDKSEMDSGFQRVKTEDNESEYSSSEQWRIWKNVLALGFAFMIHFTALWGASNLQSSINANESLGTFTLASIYGSLIVSNIFLPVVVIKWFGCKWTIALSLITYMPFIIAQFYPRFYTMIPAGLVVGFGGGPLWCAKCTYLTVAAEAYSQISGISSDVIVTRFFGVFFMFYQFSQVWGNLISSAILSNGASDPEEVSTNLTSLINKTISVVNETEWINGTENFCGANFQPGRVLETANTNFVPPPTSKIHLISGIYLACMIAACLIVALCVDSLNRYNRGRTGSGSGLSGLRLLAVTMKQLGHPYQLLILPITMFIGAEQAFIAADFTASFVSCGWGIANIGFVMICFGVCNAVSAFCTGSIVKVTGRSPVVAFALILHVALIVVMLVWHPTPLTTYMYFLVAGLWGMADAIWLVQINSLSGILFPGKEEASYSNFRLWEATGSVITYAYSPYLNTRVKIYLLLGLLFIGVTGYAIVEILEVKAKKEKLDQGGMKKFVLVHNNEIIKPKSGEVAE